MGQKVTGWRMANTCCLLIIRQQSIRYKSLSFIFLCNSYRLLTNTHNPGATHRCQKVTGWRTSNTCRLLISRQQSTRYKLLLSKISVSRYRLLANTRNPRATRSVQKVIGWYLENTCCLFIITQQSA